MHGTSEFRLFCLAMRDPHQADHIELLRRAIAAGPDWHRIIQGARRHRVASVLLSGLHASKSPHIPASVLSDLRHQALVAARQSLAQMAEIGRLSRIFAQAGVRVLALKGVALSAQLYGNPSLRNPRDIDLLVEPADFSDAEVLLTESGYRSDGPILSPKQADAYRRWVKDAGYVNALTGIRVELHHRLSDNPAFITREFSNLWDEHDVVDVAGTPVAGLPRRYLPLYLCMHGAAHCWEELRWLVDFVATLREPGSTDAAITMANNVGFGAPMLQALVLAHNWLGQVVDERHLTLARADRRVARLDEILAHFYMGSKWHQIPQGGSLAAFLRYSLWLRLYTYSLKTGWRYWGYQAMREFITPADWELIRLPDSLFWAFPLARPVGWLVRRWRH